MNATIELDAHHVPGMLPVTGGWALPFTAYLLLLSNRVIYQRLKHRQYIGGRLNSSEKDNTGDHENPDPLFLENRCLMNFLENVPLAFVLTAIAELNGGDRVYLNYAMAALFAMRVAHVELGLRAKDTLGPGRAPGILGTQGFLTGMAAYGTYLVKGYWGY
ncbi:MAG: hypothetical protein Q9170_007880 [Blastenia crenularia]